ncbi:Asp-tRNA(Asn)/Glu-tRNA(Gln) amidotransferase subunit GatB [Desulfomonile tiedjei]|uniref:Aspartyl/glutamyl-tRNA(Asn/Gln) amidotransferase subunit B n=1 Tax=Desulfomonile tiedjei (strain ATCC 49306 / DSM 6799 / DCB-1) TaxID=706587 RepID=I4C7S0_DESTA|nr:Asp-tRNA(Asn)/Glu-tRNA(Gln) amidotransferase subunit GatB [Desulfomonile tiedjei]AFM25611.1 glutamyl-tRNA(Gln) and/or aspartyl-tRNA(Asn) amidotransferase, B subunit [Desulfomonile tiedjei DSM 6799]
MEYEAVIGLEVHAQLLTDSKAFCSCTTRFGNEPNTNTCPICQGMPGVLPVLNRKALEFTVKMALACNCTINETSRFARKNYYYPDLPKNYQISQYELPVAEHGWLDVETNGEIRRIGITRIHMEEDAGKLIHDENRPFSHVDLNRTGVPLVEIVSEPEMRSPEEAADYLRALRSILVYLEVCDGNMQEGSFRCDANVSIRPKGTTALGVKAEVKNMNSFRNVQRALHYEIERQIETLKEGGRIVQETRLFDPSTGTTASMRSKEQAHDYRYFPDPDLLPLRVEPELVERMRNQLPELPAEKKERFIQLGIPAYDAGVLTASRPLADFFERTVELFPNPKAVSNWMMTEFMRELKGEEADISCCPVSPSQLANLLKSVEDGTISGKIAKTVFEEMFRTGKEPEEIIREKGLVQVSDTDELTAACREVLDANAGEVAKYLSGKTKIFGFFVGQVMKKTKGKANPGLVNSILEEELKKRSE